MFRRILAPFGAALAITAALVGCATGVTGSSSTASSSPTPSLSATAEIEVQAAWLDGGSMVGVLLSGSSTCLPMADAVTYADGVLSVSLLEPADAACTRDFVLRGIPVQVPAGVDAATDLELEVSGAGYTGSTVLPGVAGLAPGGGMDAALPSAGWAGPGAFALLTWGSSSCRPQVESAEAAGSEIAVTFATPPADQVCTADFAPRVTVVDVAGAEPGVAYEAVLSGDAFDATRVAVAGTP